jgi:alpha-glucosidase (family GH31 glycosyl hydrolase)
MAMLNAWADGTKPWSFPEVEKAVYDVASLRMQLLPYIYSSFAQYHFEGKPPFRAMNLVEGFGFASTAIEGKLDATKNPYAMSIKEDIKDQYMMGDYMLVAPVFTGEKSRKVYLPAGKWYDFYTGRLAGENEVITITPSLDKIPLFVKDGGIIPMVPPHTHAPGNGEILPLEIRCYGEGTGAFTLYDDDGVSFDYEKGNYSLVKLSTKKGADDVLSGTVEFQKNGGVWGYGKDVKWTFMSAKK